MIRPDSVGVWMSGAVVTVIESATLDRRAPNTTCLPTLEGKHVWPSRRK